MGHASTDVMQHQFPPYREVDTAAAVTAQEEGEGRDKRRKKRVRDEKKEFENIFVRHDNKPANQNKSTVGGSKSVTRQNWDGNKTSIRQS